MLLYPNEYIWFKFHYVQMNICSPTVNWATYICAYSRFSSVQSLSRVRLCDPRNCSMPSLPVHHQLPEFTQTHVHRQWCHPAISSSVVPFSSCPHPSQHQVFSKESAVRIKWPKHWSFSFSISPSNEYSGQISFRMDWLDLLAVQGTPKSLLQHITSLLST